MQTYDLSNKLAANVATNISKACQQQTELSNKRRTHKRVYITEVSEANDHTTIVVTDNLSGKRLKNYLQRMYAAYIKTI